MIEKIGFGGGCHWCTEAYFQSLKGVEKVEQGWISAAAPDDTFSEGVIVHYDPDIIPTKTLINIHLHTHASTVNHYFREKYRSAVYVFNGDESESAKAITELQLSFKDEIITRVLIFNQFKLNTETYREYYRKNRGGAFCERYISPKLQMIRREYNDHFKEI